jgi:MAPEG family
MASLLVKSGLFAVTASVLEIKYGTAEKVPAFGATPLILIGTGFWVTMHGMVVGQARQKYTQAAKDDGEENVEERYGLPNLYAQGTSKNAKAFNCVQRSHQHIFESFTQLCVSSLVAALSFPIATSVSTLLYAVGRYKNSQCYANADGDPSKRYASPLARYMWYGLVSTYLLGILSAIKIMAEQKKSLL